MLLGWQLVINLLKFKGHLDCPLLVSCHHRNPHLRKDWYRLSPLASFLSLNYNRNSNNWGFGVLGFWGVVNSRCLFIYIHISIYIYMFYWLVFCFCFWSDDIEVSLGIYVYVHVFNVWSVCFVLEWWHRCIYMCIYIYIYIHIYV